MRLGCYVRVEESVYDLTYLLFLKTEKLVAFVNITNGELASKKEGEETEEDNEELRILTETANK